MFQVHKNQGVRFLCTQASTPLPIAPQGVKRPQESSSIQSVEFLEPSPKRYKEALEPQSYMPHCKPSFITIHISLLLNETIINLAECYNAASGEKYFQCKYQYPGNNIFCDAGFADNDNSFIIG